MRWWSLKSELYTLNALHFSFLAYKLWLISAASWPIRPKLYHWWQKVAWCLDNCQHAVKQPDDNVNLLLGKWSSGQKQQHIKIVRNSSGRDYSWRSTLGFRVGLLAKSPIACLSFWRAKWVNQSLNSCPLSSRNCDLRIVFSAKISTSARRVLPALLWRKL